MRHGGPGENRYSYLGRTGFDSQQTQEPVSPDRPDNLFEALPGRQHLAVFENPDAPVFWSIDDLPFPDIPDLWRRLA